MFLFRKVHVTLKVSFFHIRIAYRTILIKLNSKNAINSYKKCTFIMNTYVRKMISLSLAN